MNSTELKDQFRLDLADTEDPYLWTDPEVYTYANDAQKMFCRKTGGLGDVSTTKVTKITFAVGDEFVKTHKSILKVREAYRTSDGRDVEVINFEDLKRRGIRLDTRIGPICAIVIGMQPHLARLYPLPSIGDTIQMIVDRLPLATIDGDEIDLEIDEQHHLHLLLWMKHLAYSKQDSETINRAKAADFKVQFEAYCASAKAEKDRAKHKTRVVGYGGY